MENKPRILIIAGLFIIVLVSAGIHINNQISHLRNQAGISLLGQDKEASACSEPKFLEAPQGESSLQENENPISKKSFL